MVEPGGGGQTDAQSGRTGTAEAERVSYLDQALWKKLSEAATSDAFAQHWLTLQSRMISKVTRAQVAFGTPDTGPFIPVARWPEQDSGAAGLDTSAERAIGERRGVIFGHRSDAAVGDGTCFAAYPFVFDDKLHGVVALEIADRAEDQLRAVMRQLQWGSVWIEAFFRRQSVGQVDQFQARADLTLDLIASTVEEERFASACLGAATEMAMRLDCERVSIGFLERGHTRVAAVSHTARFGKRTNLIRSIGAAMDEAIDQRSAVIHPTDSTDLFQVTAAHAELLNSDKSASILTIPFGDKNKFTGAMTFERSSEIPLDQVTADQLECLASVVGPILHAKQREDRLLIFKVGDSLLTQIKRIFGRRYYGRKLAVSLIALTVLLAGMVVDVYRVSATATLEGQVRRVVVAPFDGYVLTENARAGDRVKTDAVLAELDIHDLALERLRRISTRSQRLAEFNQALAERKAAQVNVIRAQIDQADAEIALLDEQIGRSKLRAPFDGLVISGDLSQSVGSSVNRGDVLFEVGPLNAYRVILLVDDRQITDIEVGQKGDLLLSSIPDEPFPITIKTITPVSDARDGRNVFQVEAGLNRITDRLRPGMEGIAKVEIGERRLVWIWTNPLVDWLRVTLWSWWP